MDALCNGLSGSEATKYSTAKFNNLNIYAYLEMVLLYMPDYKKETIPENPALIKPGFSGIVSLLYIRV